MSVCSFPNPYCATQASRRQGHSCVLLVSSAGECDMWWLALFWIMFLVSLKAYSFLPNYSDCWLLLSHSHLSQGRQLSSLRGRVIFFWKVQVGSHEFIHVTVTLTYGLFASLQTHKQLLTLPFLVQDESEAWFEL